MIFLKNRLKYSCLIVLLCLICTACPVFDPVDALFPSVFIHDTLSEKDICIGQETVFEVYIPKNDDMNILVENKGVINIEKGSLIEIYDNMYLLEPIIFDKDYYKCRMCLSFAESGEYTIFWGGVEKSLRCPIEEFLFKDKLLITVHE